MDPVSGKWVHSSAAPVSVPHRCVAARLDSGGDVYVAVDGDRCYLPLPRDLPDMRVSCVYAQLTVLITTLGPGVCDYFVYTKQRSRATLAQLPND